MAQENNPKSNEPPTSLEELADGAQESLLQEFKLFIVENKAWWMIPIVTVMVLVGILVALTATGATPFIYSIF